MFYAKPVKPTFPVALEAPDGTNFFLHKGESQAAYQKAAQLVNFLQEMMKWMPTPEVYGYETGSETPYKVNGDYQTGHGDIYYVDDAGRICYDADRDGSVLSFSDIDEVMKVKYQHAYSYNDNQLADVKNRVAGTEGYLRNNTTDAYTYDNYTNNMVGAHHPISVEDAGSLVGYGFGKEYKNIDFHSSAGDFNCFEDEATANLIDETSFLNVVDYENALKSADPYGNNPLMNKLVQYYDVSRDSTFTGMNLQDISAFMTANFGNMTFYEIMIKCVQANWNDKNGDGFVDSGEIAPEIVNLAGNKLIDDDAKKFVLAILESRRRIYYGMSYLYGHCSLKNYGPMLDGTTISDGDFAVNTQAMMDRLSYVMNVELKGLDQHNAKILGNYLTIQHAFARTCDNYTKTDYVNGMAIETWLKDRDRTLVSSNGDGTAQTTDGELTVEDGSFNQNIMCLGNDAYLVSHKNYWDEYDTKVVADIPSTATVTWGADGVPVDMLWLPKPTNGLSRSQILGYSQGTAVGGSMNLFEKNWAVHAFGEFLKLKESDTQRVYTTNTINDLRRQQYRQEKRSYMRRMEEYKDAQYNEARAAAMAESKYYSKKESEQKQAESAIAKQAALTKSQSKRDTTDKLKASQKSKTKRK
ncbi:MAG: hypothetical protein PHH14_05400 [Candidatus Margulisbacteria bacterium]|nr:hypothetical protein [Candidatus Margulisiibacteriota bacterium]